MEDRKTKTTEWFPRGAKILDPGIYKAELKAVTPGIGKGYGKDQSERHTLMFSFREVKSGAVINRTVTRTNSEKSQLVTLVRSMTGADAPSPSTIGDADSFKDFILSLVGKTFLIQVNPSADGRYNNLLACFPASKGA